MKRPVLCFEVYIVTNIKLKLTTAVQNYADKSRHHSNVFLMGDHFIVSFYISVKFRVMSEVY